MRRATGRRRSILAASPAWSSAHRTARVKAFNAVCTHLQCTVEFRPAKADIFCNCHNGVYNLNGRNVSGPPPRPLEEYKVTLRGTPGQRPDRRRSLSPEPPDDRPAQADAETARGGVLLRAARARRAPWRWPPRSTSPSTARRFSIFSAAWPCFCSASRWPRASFCRCTTSPRPIRRSRACGRS